jgi:Sec-independent protein translocase protein TatA
MPELNLKDIRKDFRLPELRLPEMSRDDIAKALGEARKELSEVRRDLNEFRREFEMPKVETTTVEIPKVVDMTKVSQDAEKLGKDARKMAKDVRKSAKEAAQKAGLIRRPSRIPFVLVGLATMGLVAWALATPGVKGRLREAAQQAQKRMAERRTAWDLDEETRAFDASTPAGVKPSPYKKSIDPVQSPFSEPPTEVPEGLGATGETHTIEKGQPAARA